MSMMTEYNPRPEDVGEILVKVSALCYGRPICQEKSVLGTVLHPSMYNAYMCRALHVTV